MVSRAGLWFWLHKLFVIAYIFTVIFLGNWVFISEDMMQTSLYSNRGLITHPVNIAKGKSGDILSNKSLGRLALQYFAPFLFL